MSHARAYSAGKSTGARRRSSRVGLADLEEQIGVLGERIAFLAERERACRGRLTASRGDLGVDDPDSLHRRLEGLRAEASRAQRRNAELDRFCDEWSTWIRGPCKEGYDAVVTRRKSYLEAAESMLPLWGEVANKETSAAVAQTKAQLERIKQQKQDAVKHLAESQRLGGELQRLRTELREQQQDLPHLYRTMALEALRPATDLDTGSPTAAAVVSEAVAKEDALALLQVPLMDNYFKSPATSTLAASTMAPLPPWQQQAQHAALARQRSQHELRQQPVQQQSPISTQHPVTLQPSPHGTPVLSAAQAAASPFWGASTSADPCLHAGGFGGTPCPQMFGQPWQVGQQPSPMMIPPMPVPTGTMGSPAAWPFGPVPPWPLGGVWPVGFPVWPSTAPSPSPGGTGPQEAVQQHTAPAAQPPASNPPPAAPGQPGTQSASQVALAAASSSPATIAPMQVSPLPTVLVCTPTEAKEEVSFSHAAVVAPRVSSPKRQEPTTLAAVAAAPVQREDGNPPPGAVGKPGSHVAPGTPTATTCNLQVPQAPQSLGPPTPEAARAFGSRASTPKAPPNVPSPTGKQADTASRTASLQPPSAQTQDLSREHDLQPMAQQAAQPPPSPAAEDTPNEQPQATSSPQGTTGAPNADGQGEVVADTQPPTEAVVETVDKPVSQEAEDVEVEENREHDSEEEEGPPPSVSQQVAGCVAMLLHPLNGTPCSSTDVRRFLREATRGEAWATVVTESLSAGDMDKLLAALPQLMPAQVLAVALEITRRYMDSSDGATEGDGALRCASSPEGPIALMHALSMAEQDDNLMAWHELLAYLISLPGTLPLSAQDALCKVVVECLLPIPRFKGEQVKRLTEACSRLLRGDTDPLEEPAAPTGGRGGAGGVGAKPLVGIGDAGATRAAGRAGNGLPPSPGAAKSKAQPPAQSAYKQRQTAATEERQAVAASTSSYGNGNGSGGTSAYQRAKMEAAGSRATVGGAGAAGASGTSGPSIQNASNTDGLSAYARAKLASTGGSVTTLVYSITSVLVVSAWQRIEAFDIPAMLGRSQERAPLNGPGVLRLDQESDVQQLREGVEPMVNIRAMYNSLVDDIVTDQESHLQQLREVVEPMVDIRAMYNSLVDDIVTDQDLMGIPMHDHTIVRGHAVFDICSVVNGRLRGIDTHLDSLLLGALQARTPLPFEGSVEENKERMRSIIGQTVFASGLRRCSVRFFTTVGPGSLGLVLDGCTSAFYVVVYLDDTCGAYDQEGVVTEYTFDAPLKPSLSATTMLNTYTLNALTAMGLAKRFVDEGLLCHRGLCPWQSGGIAWK